MEERELWWCFVFVLFACILAVIQNFVFVIDLVVVDSLFAFFVVVVLKCCYYSFLFIVVVVVVVVVIVLT